MPAPSPPPAVPARVRAAFVLAAAIAGATLVGCTNDSGSPEEFCTQVRKVPALESVLARFSEADADVLQDRVDRARNAYDELADAAPAEIADETEQVVSLVNDVLDAVEQNPNDPAEASAQLRTAMDDHKGVADDREAVAAYAQEQCGVQLDATLSDGTTSTAVTTTTASSTDPAETTTTEG